MENNPVHKSSKEKETENNIHKIPGITLIQNKTKQNKQTKKLLAF